MPEYEPLTPEERAEIVAEYYAARERKTTAQDRPTIVLVGGQPGAGKSAASRISRAELAGQGGYLHIDADRMRDRIVDPNGAAPTSAQTQADAGALATGLRAMAIAGRRNIIEEGTFRNPEGIEAFIAERVGQGYRVELLAVATPRAESVLGVFQRFEAQLARGARNPRFVSEAYHDEALEGFTRTVARNARNLDRVRIVSRDGRIHYDSISAGRGTSVFSALSTAQRITDERLAAVAHAWSEVKKQAEGRGADTAYLGAIERNAQETMDAQKGRIHSHALARLEANNQSISADERFAGHTDQELAKVAYYRGFHEKSFEFKGLKTDFQRFDTLMANRLEVQNLPDVAELEGRQLRTRSRGQEDDGHSL